MKKCSKSPDVAKSNDLFEMPPEEKAVHHLDHFIKSDLLTTNSIKDDDKETTNDDEK
jgi:hypothetical protein